MTAWGDVLEAMHLAPRGVRTVRLVVDQGHLGAPPSASAPPATTSGGTGTTTTGRSRAIVTFSMASAGDDPSAGRATLWTETGGRRYRIHRGARLNTVVDGTDRWSEMGDSRVVRTDVAAQPDQDPLLLLANPEVLLGWFRFEDHDGTTTLDRPAHWIRGTRRNTPMGALLDFILPGDTADAIIDAETGVLLDLQLRSDATPTVSMHVTECGFDDFDPDEVLRYEPAPGARILTPEELHAEHVAEHGGRFGAAAFERPPLAETSMAVGPPPDDPEAASAAIRHAVEHLTDIDDDDRCPNIQGGENLAECVRRSRQSPFVDDEGATFECGEIAFVRADEADVRFRVVVPRAPMGGIDTQGRALLIDGRWVVDRATACRLFSMAGVTCPPPPAR